MREFSEALITRVVVRGFRSLENVTVDLAPVTVLVGPNGAGKSAFIDALAFLQQAIYDSPKDAFQRRGGFREVLTRTGQQPNTVSIEVHLKSRAPQLFAGSYFVKFQETRRNLTVEQEICEISHGANGAVHRFAVERGRWREAPEGITPSLTATRLALPLMTSLEYFAPIYAALTAMYSYDITLHSLTTLQIPDTGARLTRDGSNAASVLKRLRAADEAAYDNIVQTIAHIVPSIREITPKKQGQRVTLEFRESFANAPDLSCAAESMSEGPLRALSILLAVCPAEPPTLVSLEEPETAIHPGAAAAVAEALQEAGLRTQLLITTQSPDLITRFAVEALRAVERTAAGVTVIAPIAKAQRAAIARRLFTAGELHRIDGLRPAPVVREEMSADA